MFFTILGLIVVFVIAAFAFVSFAPQIGQKPEGTDLARIQKSPHYDDGEFQNQIETKMGSFSEMMSTLPDFLFGKNKSPKDTLTTKFNPNLQAKNVELVTWFGHSAFLIQLEGKRILIDPMLGNHASPLSFVTKRFPIQPEINIAGFDSIDAVLISHDHYDHLDYATIKQMQNKVGQFYTGLGVGSHLKKWGVNPEKITELDWDQSATLDNITFIACPARHFSGRGFADRNSTQWVSWAIQSQTKNLYFSGDSGYGPHFKSIGEKYGPFDLSFIECGQYNEAWEAIHMLPEQSVQACIDLNSNLNIPIHWGAFSLSIHSWTEPVERFQKAAIEQNVNYCFPTIGQEIELDTLFDNPSRYHSEWWKEIK